MFDGRVSEVNRGKHAMIMLKLHEVFGQFGDLYPPAPVSISNTLTDKYIDDENAY